MEKKFIFENRDVSWLTFNERVLEEAGKRAVPLLERLKFLSIFSSNLDEFYRVRIPSLLALKKIKKGNSAQSVYSATIDIVNRQLNKFGSIFTGSILPALKGERIFLLYDEKLPDQLTEIVSMYFFCKVAGLLEPVLLSEAPELFPVNNSLYKLVILETGNNEEKHYLLNIPAGDIPRFLHIKEGGNDFVVFLDDVIQNNLDFLFKGAKIKGSYNIKITRDAELNLLDEYAEDLAERIEKQLEKRDFGYATRLLYEPGIPPKMLEKIIHHFNLQKASIVEGGKYHNLKDLMVFPVTEKRLTYPVWVPIQRFIPAIFNNSLLNQIAARDIIIHTPYESYDTILRFFNEAVIDQGVEEIYTTLYRVASDSRIVSALITAAKLGKKVTVIVELKARFDEANNIHWARKMKQAGVKIIYSSVTFKVHAKIALLKMKRTALPFIGLMATGNLNENTARFYTDHILLTSRQEMLKEMDELFSFLSKGKKPEKEEFVQLAHLLVAPFNLQNRFIALLDREIVHARMGLPAVITIKLNNLEEKKLIEKLYEASNAGVQIKLIVRSICCLVPGIKGQSENITVKRIVDRYLEHGRVFIFHNNGSDEVFMGSSDWMERNIYRRIEVCFPVYDVKIRQQLMETIALQWQDDGSEIRSQELIYKMLQSAFYN
jgi:polyphosphate kinase